MSEPPGTSPPESFSLSPVLRIALCAMSLGAAAIHFVVIGGHLREYVLFGIFFAVVAWLQAAWAVGIVAAPSERLLLGGLLGNLAVIAIWVVSRTTGVPIGPAAGQPEAASLIDIVCTALEILIVVGCATVLLAQARGRATYPGGRVALVVAGSLAVLSIPVTTAAIVPAASAAHNHALATHDTHADGSHDAHHLVGGSGIPDPFQIDEIRRAMDKYEDVRVAFHDGWESDGSDWTEIGSHFYRDGDWDGSFPARSRIDLADPEFLMYSKRLTGHWKLVAIAYVVDQALYPKPPTNLKGAQYHEHRWNCIADGEELEEEDWGVLSKKECAIMDGKWSPGAVWMTHVWFVDNPDGTFAELNPTLV